MKIEKLYLIYVYEHLDRSNAKLFNEISSKEKTQFEWDFTTHTELENQIYLKKWKKENGIRLTDYKTIEEVGYKEDKNGTPIFITKKKEKN